MFDHLVVLMLENRSFDNMLGVLYDRNRQPTIRQPWDNHIFYGLDFNPDATAPANDNFGAPFRMPPACSLAGEGRRRAGCCFFATSVTRG
jgi:phospholipase C